MILKSGNQTLFQGSWLKMVFDEKKGRLISEIMNNTKKIIINFIINIRKEIREMHL